MARKLNIVDYVLRSAVDARSEYRIKDEELLDAIRMAAFEYLNKQREELLSLKYAYFKRVILPRVIEENLYDVDSLENHFYSYEDAVVTKVFLEDAMALINEVLSPRQKLVIELRLQGKTLHDVGCELGLTQERIRQIELKAHKSARKVLYHNGYNKHIL